MYSPADRRKMALHYRRMREDRPTIFKAFPAIKNPAFKSMSRGAVRAMFTKLHIWLEESKYYLSWPERVLVMHCNELQWTKALQYWACGFTASVAFWTFSRGKRSYYHSIWKLFFTAFLNVYPLAVGYGKGSSQAMDLLLSTPYLTLCKKARALAFEEIPPDNEYLKHMIKDLDTLTIQEKDYIGEVYGLDPNAVYRNTSNPFKKADLNVERMKKHLTSSDPVGAFNFPDYYTEKANAWEGISPEAIAVLTGAHNAEAPYQHTEWWTRKRVSIQDKYRNPDSVLITPFPYGLREPRPYEMYFFRRAQIRAAQALEHHNNLYWGPTSIKDVLISPDLLLPPTKIPFLVTRNDDSWIWRNPGTQRIEINEYSPTKDALGEIRDEMKYERALRAQAQGNNELMEEFNESMARKRYLDAVDSAAVQQQMQGQRRKDNNIMELSRRNYEIKFGETMEEAEERIRSGGLA